MPTLNQLVKKRRINKKHKVKPTALGGCPHREGTCTRITTMNPKKPNSAVRKIVKLKLFHNRRKRVVAYINGIGHPLNQHNRVLIRGGRTRDLPGLQHKLVKGNRDFVYAEAIYRQNRRSRYGIPRMAIGLRSRYNPAGITKKK